MAYSIQRLYQSSYRYNSTKSNEMTKTLSTKKNTLRYITLMILIFLFPYCNNDNVKKTEPSSLSDSIPSSTDSGDSESSLNNKYNLDKLNYMRLLYGRFLDSGTYTVPATTRNDLTQTIDSLNNTGNNLVIYFHGGLIPLKSAYKDPKRTGLDKTFRNAGYFPYYILYGANPYEIWSNRRRGLTKMDEDANFADITTDPPSPLDSAFDHSYTYKSYVYLLIQLNRKFNPKPGFAKNSYKKIEDTLNLLDILEKEVAQSQATKSSFVPTSPDKRQLAALKKELYNDTTFRALARQDALMDPDFISTKGDPDEFVKWLFNIDDLLPDIKKRFDSGRSHGPIMTITEEAICNSPARFLKKIRALARDGWEQQKKDVDTPFTNDSNLYGGIALLDELLRLDNLQKKKGTLKKIYLIGSSTGAIFLCNFLIRSSEAKYRQLHYNVIFSVPSCTFRLFDSALKKAGENIKSLHLFTLSDSTDQHPVGGLLKKVYPGSVLFLVSGVCEEKENPYHDMPLLGLQKFYINNFANNKSLTKPEASAIKAVMDRLKMVNGKSKYVAWSNEDSPNPYLKNCAKGHKEVIRDKDVQQSIHYILTN